MFYGMCISDCNELLIGINMATYDLQSRSSWLSYERVLDMKPQFSQLGFSCVT